MDDKHEEPVGMEMSRTGYLNSQKRELPTVPGYTEMRIITKKTLPCVAVKKNMNLQTHRITIKDKSALKSPSPGNSVKKPTLETLPEENDEDPVAPNRCAAIRAFLLGLFHLVCGLSTISIGDVITCEEAYLSTLSYYTVWSGTSFTIAGIFVIVGARHPSSCVTFCSVGTSILATLLSPVLLSSAAIDAYFGCQESNKECTSPRLVWTCGVALMAISVAEAVVAVSTAVLSCWDFCHRHRAPSISQV